MSEFILNTKIDNLFLIGLSEIEQRLDAEFYLEDFDFTDFIKLRNIAKVKGGKRLPKGFYYSENETDYLYLQVSNLNSDNEINWQTAKYISEEVFEILERYETVESDLVFSIAGSIGKINVVKNIPEGKKVILTENASKIHFKKDVQVIPEFIELVLKTPILQKQIKLNYIQTTIPKIGLDRIENLFIPELPSIEKQRECLEYFESAFESKQQKNKEAKELLSSIDNYLLGELGIVLPEKDNSLQNRIFNSLLSDVSSNRFDCDYYKTYYQKLIESIEKSSFNTKSLDKVCYLVSNGKTPAKSDYSEEPTDYPIIKVGSYTNDHIDLKKVDYSHSSNSITAEKGDIFILSAAHQAEYVGRHIKYLNVEPKLPTSFVGELICVRANESKCNSMFLFSLLNTELYKSLLNREKTGQTSHIYGKDIKKIKIPIPSPENQLEIANHISEIHIKSKTLLEEASLLIKEAKSEVEKIILG